MPEWNAVAPVRSVPSWELTWALSLRKEHGSVSATEMHPALSPGRSPQVRAALEPKGSCSLGFGFVHAHRHASKALGTSVPSVRRHELGAVLSVPCAVRRVWSGLFL